MPLHELTAFQRDLVYLIAGLGDSHGLGLKTELEDYYETEIHHGRLYPNLDSLVDKGLVTKSKKDARTNAYALSDEGERALAARRSWTGERV